MRNSKETSGVLRPRKRCYPEVIPGIQLPNKSIERQGLFSEFSNPSDDAVVIAQGSLAGRQRPSRLG